MHIIVCVKQIPNPEIAATQFRVDEQAKQVVPLADTSPASIPLTLTEPAMSSAAPCARIWRRPSA